MWYVSKAVVRYHDIYSIVPAYINTYPAYCAHPNQCLHPDCVPCTVNYATTVEMVHERDWLGAEINAYYTILGISLSRGYITDGCIVLGSLL